MRPLYQPDVARLPAGALAKAAATRPAEPRVISAFPSAISFPWTPALAIFLFAPLALAQPTVAPTDAQVGEPRGENTPAYNIRQSFELGYRWHTVDGSEPMYRSTVNFSNGVRLLGTSLSVQSREAHGHLFDQIVLNSQGLGNDPYQWANFRIEKNRMYRYDLTWRSNAYYNPALQIANGQHLLDTVRNLQDQDFTLFPQGSFKFFVGYSRNTQSGPGLSTINLFDATRGDEFATFANIRREQNEYRAGTDITVLGFRLNLMHAWVDFKEDTPFSLTTPSAGNATVDDDTTLRSFRRTEPYHGTSPYWRAALFRESKWWAANGRFTYVAGNRAFVSDEFASGTNRLAAPITRQTLVFGDARRPAATGNLTFSLFPAENVTITNQTSLYHIRMQGDLFYSQADNSGRPFQVANFNFLGIRTIANSTDAEVRLGKRVAVHGEYTYDSRRIRSTEGFQVPGSSPGGASLEQTNQLHAGVLGFRIRPGRGLSINLDAEIGRTDNPFYPISERNYHALRGRIEYKVKRYRIAGYSRTYYNTNSESLANYAARSRQSGVDFTWTARSWFSIDASYSKQHLGTIAAIEYFAVSGFRNQVVQGEQSYYVSNIHTGLLAARFTIRDRADVSLGYSHIQDVGDGRLLPFVNLTQAALNATKSPFFYTVQTFPLRFNSPMAKLSIRITNKVRWNAGYQHYGYREDFSTLQNYRAHTGYTSVSWAF